MATYPLTDDLSRDKVDLNWASLKSDMTPLRLMIEQHKRNWIWQEADGPDLPVAALVMELGETQALRAKTNESAPA
jgi:hypothetical protein